MSNKKFILPNKEIQVIDTNSSSVEITLPAVVGKPQSIKNNGTSGNSVTVHYGSSTFILHDGNSTTFIYDGEDWITEKYYADGLAISHEWNGTELRIKNANETWGDYVDLEGPQGQQGIQGDMGPVGPMGIGVPTGGETGEFLLKNSNSDFDFSWTNIEAVKGILHLQHTVSPAIASGTVTAGLWNIGPLNTLKENTIAGASLNTGLNEFTLPAGKYKLTGFRGCFYTNAYATRLYNVTDDTTELIGMNGYADQGDGYNSEHIPIQGVIDIDSPKTFRLELYAQTTRANDGWGFETNSYGGLDRVWSDILVEDISSIRGPKGEDGADGTTTVDTATGNFNVTGNLITKTVQMYNGNNSINQKDVRLEMTPTGLQFNLYDDTGTFIRTILEQSYDTPIGGLLLSAPLYRKRWIGDALGVAWQVDSEKTLTGTGVWDTLAIFSASKYYGEYRLSAQLYGDSADCIYRVLINGTEVGRATHRGGYTTYTIDFVVEVGDRIEFQGYRTDNDIGDRAGVRYQKLICDSKSIIRDYFSPTEKEI